MGCVETLTVERVDAAFKALASAQRREILRILDECGSGSGRHSASERAEACVVPGLPGSTGDRPGEVCACKISERLGLAPSTISHHMRALQQAGFVTGRKDGTWVHYTLQRELLRAVAGELLRLSESSREEG